MVAFSGPGLHEEAAGKSAVKVREAVTGRLCIIDGPPERTAPTFGDVTLAVLKVGGIIRCMGRVYGRQFS